MYLIYVAGPYRAQTTWAINKNIINARNWGMLIAEQGAYPVIPHSNTSNFDGPIPDDFWLNGTLKLLSRCDGAVFINGWTKSSGSRGEWSLAEKLSIPVFDAEELDLQNQAGLAPLKAWLKNLK